MILLYFLLSQYLVPQQEYRITGQAQGTTYSIMYYAKDSISKTSVENVFSQIDSSLSLYKPYSLINRFNAAPRGVVIDEHLKKVVTTAKKISADTDGLFDITVRPLMKLWGFGDKKREALPDSATVKNAMECTGFNKILIKGDSLIKTKPCVEIDVDGIAQGYTVDVVSKFLEKKNIKNYLVEIGGEIRTKGKKPNGDIFTVAIESPDDDQRVPLKNKSITTSGNYRKYVTIQNKQVPHLINAKTGYPVPLNHISISVIAKDAITADAYDNALMAMETKDAFRFLQKRKYLQAHFIYEDEAGQIKDTATAKFWK